MTFDERLVAISTAKKLLAATQTERQKAIELWNRALTEMGIVTTHRLNGNPAPSYTTSYDLYALGKAVADWTMKVWALQNELNNHQQSYEDAKRKIGAL